MGVEIWLLLRKLETMMTVFFFFLNEVSVFLPRKNEGEREENDVSYEQFEWPLLRGLWRLVKEVKT